MFSNKKCADSQSGFIFIHSGYTRWRLYVKSDYDEKQECEVCLAILYLDKACKDKSFEIDYHFEVLDKNDIEVFKSREDRKSSIELVEIKDRWCELFTVKEFMMKESQLLDESRILKIVCQVCVSLEY